MAQTCEQVFSIEKSFPGSGRGAPGSQSIIVRTGRREDLDVLEQAMGALNRKLALVRGRQQAARIARLTEVLIEGGPLSAAAEDAQGPDNTE